MMRIIRKKSPNMRQLARETGFAYPQVRTVLQDFQRYNLIEPVFNIEQEGREYNIRFTQKGLKILTLLEELERSIK